MSFLTVDFETYYGDKLGFKTQTTEEYIRDPRFHVIGVGVKVDDEESKWFSGSHVEIQTWLRQFDWQQSAVLCHNTLFDGAILSWIFDIHPAMYMDTLCMARAIHGVEAGGSLAALATRYNLGVKGTEVLNAYNKKREDFTPDELARYGDYCNNDVELTYRLFNILAKDFPESELELIDMTLKMFTEPVLQINDALLEQRLIEIREEKQKLLGELVERLECGQEPDPEEAVRKKLSSNKQFAEVLKGLGVDVPMKESPATGKQTFALAKNDEGFVALSECDDPFIQQLCAVRLGTKSTLEESRITRFLEIGGRNRGKIPIPLKYYGAHTGRWAGLDKVNFQNLPSRDKKKKTLKNAVEAPDGHVIVNCDSSQIEARVLAWLAGQTELVEAFAKGEDVYSIFASKIYEREISKANPVERFVGKTCILGLGYGTGAEKLRLTLKTSPPGAVLSVEECKSIVNIYRTDNERITALWKECDQALSHMMNWPEDGQPFYIGEHEVVLITKDGIKLPNGLYIRYPNLRLTEDGAVYDSRKGPVNIWGGAMVENIVQALARIIVGEQMLDISKKYFISMTVHDAAVVVVKDTKSGDLESGVEFIINKMSYAPSWARGLPVACEAKFAQSYGGC